MWVLTIGVLEVNPELDSIRAQRGRARSALFSRVLITFPLQVAWLPPRLTSRCHSTRLRKGPRSTMTAHHNPRHKTSPTTREVRGTLVTSTPLWLSKGPTGGSKCRQPSTSLRTKPLHQTSWHPPYPLLLLTPLQCQLVVTSPIRSSH